nr:hypothetical protein [uncultured Acetatifactor sp.]
MAINAMCALCTWYHDLIQGMKRPDGHKCHVRPVHMVEQDDTGELFAVQGWR